MSPLSLLPWAALIIGFADGKHLRSSLPSEIQNDERNLIINGDDASETRYPWMVRYRYDETLCGGSLIVSPQGEKMASVIQNMRQFVPHTSFLSTPQAPDLVLTAGHCYTDDQNLGEAQVSRYDLHRSYESFEVRRVVERYPHPRYRHSTTDQFNPSNDIAILKLNTPVNSVEPVKLNFDESFPSSKTDSEGNLPSLTILGWGSTTNGGVGTTMDPSNVLQEATTHYVPFEQCATARDPSTGYMYGYSISRTVVGGDWLCTQNQSSASCRGDSGGPVFSPRSSESEQDVLVAVISSSVGGCDNEYLPQINQRISHHAEWIKQVGCEVSANPPADWRCGETESPTKAPTPAPTAAPTKSPIRTPAPSVATTEAPSTTITSSPTISATSSKVTHAPSLGPTQKPTSSPTESPFRKPIDSQTQSEPSETQSEPSEPQSSSGGFRGGRGGEKGQLQDKKFAKQDDCDNAPAWRLGCIVRKNGIFRRRKDGGLGDGAWF